MWFYRYYFLIFIPILIKCNIVDNNDAQKGLYEKVYIAKNIEHSEINSKFSEIMHAINSTRKHGTNGQEIELAGTIIILSKVDKHKAHSKDRTTDARYGPENRHKKSKEQKNAPNLRKSNRKIVVVIVNSTNKRVSFARKGLSIEDSRDSKVEPKNKEIDFKSNILRNRYADACIKVAVRKCYKALTAVNKNICKARYRCKSSLKSYFKNKSKVGCIKEFDYTKMSNYSTKYETMLKKKRASGKFAGKKFVDATREGYLDACIPFMVPNYKLKKKSHKSIALRNDTLATTFQDVLRRSRSERECQRLSRAKCVRACHFAAKEACVKYDCSRRWKKAFRLVCKEECRRAYQIKRSSDSSDSDTSGSY